MSHTHTYDHVIMTEFEMINLLAYNYKVYIVFGISHSLEILTNYSQSLPLQMYMIHKYYSIKELRKYGRNAQYI